MTFTIGTPSAPQQRFFESRARFTAYGGARGGGKSWAVRKKAALLALRYPGLRLLLMRHTYPELRENHILPLQADLRGLAQYKETEKAFTFVTGSRLVMGYCDTAGDIDRYQGQEFDVIFLDEATQFTEWQFRVLCACLRGPAAVPKRFYLTCNPGGVGHAWVKRLFVARQYLPGEDPADYCFIPARVYDNAALMANDPDYIKALQSLPAEKRAAWLDGSWDVLEGQFLPEFSPAAHLMAPFALPAAWPRYFAMDYGLDMLAGYWAAMSPQGTLYVYRELCRPNLLMSQAAQAILAANGTDRVTAWFAPPDLWNRRQDTGRSVADAFAEAGLGLMRVSNDRVMGWLELKEWLNPAAPTGPRLKIFTTCPTLAESLPNLLCDPANPGDCLTQPHQYTHGPDALRYLVSGRPWAAPAARTPRHSNADPLAGLITYGRNLI